MGPAAAVVREGIGNMTGEPQTNHWNYATTKASDFLSDLPWGFPTVCLGDTLIASFPDGLVGRITMTEGDADPGDKTMRQVVGFRVEVVSRRSGPLMEQLFRMADFESERAQSEKIRLRKSKSSYACVDEAGKHRKPDDDFMLPICRAIAVFLQVITKGELPEVPPEHAESPAPAAEAGSDALMPASGDGVVALIDLD